MLLASRRHAVHMEARQEDLLSAVPRLRRVKLRVWELGQSHQESLAILALFVSLRLSLLLISRPQGYLFDFSDYDFYLEFGKLSDRGLYPILHYWTEYPPLLPWLSVALYRATETLPTLVGSSIFWFRLALGSVMLLFDVGNLALIYWLARTLHSSRRALQVAWSYALLFTPLHVWLAWFDTIPLFFLLLSLALAVKGRYGGAAVAAGFGFMVKVVPLLALPALLKAEQRPLLRVRWMVAAAASALLVAAPFLLLGQPYLLASFGSILFRSPWETLWAIAEGYYGYGWVAPLEERMDPSSAFRPAYPTHLPWPAITAAFAALYLYLWTRRMDTRRPMTAVALTGLTVILFLLFSKGYSPQFLIYVVPFALLLLPSLRAIGYLALLGAINLLEFPVYGQLFTGQHWFLRDLVLARFLLLLLLTWEFLAILELAPSAERIRGLAAAGAVAAFALWSALALPQAGHEWARASLERRQDASLVEYLRSAAGADSVVVFTEQWLYRDLYPYLHQSTNLLLIDTVPRGVAGAGAARGLPDSTLNADLYAQLARLSSRYREIYGVRHLKDEEGRRVERLLSYREQLRAVRQAEEIIVSRWTASPLERSAGS